MRVLIEGTTISIERDDGTVIRFTDQECEALGLNVRSPANQSQSSLYPAKRTRRVDDLTLTTDAHHTVVAMFLADGLLETGLILIPELARRLQHGLAAKLEVIDASAPSKNIQ